MITLDTPLGVTEGFLTELEADVYLEDISAKWKADTDENKLFAISTTRHYLESHYTATITGAIPEELKYANALLANDYVIGKASFESGTKIKKKVVKAGPVLSEKEFAGTGDTEPSSWPIVKSILQALLGDPITETAFIIRA